jgi:Restriction endonuclease
MGPTRKSAGWRDYHVECKLWKTAVPKAQVLTLVQVAQDVGADRAFLLSEKGFQAGAIAVVKKTNISLTNINELHAVAADYIAEVSIKDSLTAVKALEHELHGILNIMGLRVQTTPEVDETLTLNGASLEITLAATNALIGHFPILLPTHLELSAPEVYTNDMAVVAAALSRSRNAMAVRSAALKVTLSEMARQAAYDAETLIHRVQGLLACGDALLRATPDFEEVSLMAALRAMKSVGSRAEILREVPVPDLVRAVKTLMRELIDGTYRWMADRARTPSAWEEIKGRTQMAISGLAAAVERSRYENSRLDLAFRKRSQ